MKHILIAIIAVLGVMLREQLVSSTKGCPRRYLRRINGKCYYFSVKKMNWYGALNNCLRKGLTLADLSNPKDFYGAIDFLSSMGNTEDFWFGGNDLQTEGRFQYISNGRLVRYYGNHSMVEPAENSECDDCLEARIRSNMTVVSDDNCLERQYFICSERYCDDVSVKKPRHHSHEHLHHFHHDVGVPSEEVEEDLKTPSPYDDDLEEEHKNESEEGVLPEIGSNESGPADEAKPDAESESPATEKAATEETIPAEGKGEIAAGQESTPAGEAKPASEETTAGAEGALPAEAETTAAAEETTAAAEETTAAAEDTTAAAEDTTAAAEGTTAAEGTR